MVKIFDISSYDMSTMLTLDYVPTAAVWLPKQSVGSRQGHGSGVFSHVAVADLQSSLIRVYNVDSDNTNAIAEISIHSSPVK